MAFRDQDRSGSPAEERPGAAIGKSPDTGHAVQLAERVWWVGRRSPDVGRQSNSYLIEQGEQSVLVDPGPGSLFPETRRKIEEVVPLDHVRWFVCHHQDPGNSTSLPLIDRQVGRSDARVVGHGRAEAMVRHYGLGMPFWAVEEHGWRLQLQDRMLRFVFTPYAPYPGSFCSFDDHSGILFSGDLFGGRGHEAGLFARNEEWFDVIRPYHEHQMPSGEVLDYALRRIDGYPLEMIAPRHGALIPPSLIPYMMQKLKGLDCGLYLLARPGTDTRRLSRLNQVLKEITSTMVVSRDFREIADRLLAALGRMLPAEALEFYVQLEDDTVLHLARESRYRGVAASPPADITRLFGTSREEWQAGNSRSFRIESGTAGDHPRISMPLFKGDEEWMYGIVLIRLSHGIEVDADIDEMMEQMAVPLEVAVERETIYRSIELERQKFYERSIRDALTGLFTRFYMEDTLRRLFEIHDRGGGTPVALSMVDIDHFKRINDTHGHLSGDAVLRQVAQVIQADARAGDLPVRLGGEEFGIIVVGEPAVEIAAIAERLRQKVESIRFPGNLSRLRVTVSIGTAIRQVGESIPAFMERADLALYQAKNGGRNQVRSAHSSVAAGQWTLAFE